MTKETEQFLQMTGSLLNVAKLLRTPEALTPPTQDLSVEVGRKTLRMLRNLQGLHENMESWLRIDDLQAQAAKAELLKTLIFIYVGQVKIAQLTNPDLLNHFTVENANDAAGAVALSVALHTLDILPETRPEFAPLDESLDELPATWDLLQAQSVEHLLDDIEGGLSHLLNKPMGDRSPLDQLLEISEKIKQTARELYSIDTLEEPAREESIELAREILRRLKNMVFSDKPIEDAVDKGKPNEKLAFARKIGEMVDMYKNLLSQATTSNPELLRDPRVKKANDSVDDCANGVALMAFRELPSNMVASLTSNNNNAELKDLERKAAEQRTAENIMKNMEGGIDIAAEEISANKEQNSKSESKEHTHKNNAEQAKAQAEAARAARRRARRDRAAMVQQQQQAPRQPTPQPQQNRLQTNRSQTNVVSSQAGQTRQSQTTQVQNTKTQNTQNQQVKSTKNSGLAGLDMEAISAIRQAGSALRSSSQQARGLLNDNAKLAQASAQATQTGGGGGDKRGVSGNSGKAEEVSADDKISPDDKSFAQREQDQKNNPNNPRNPRNRLV